MIDADQDQQTLVDIRRAAENAENAGDPDFIAGLFTEHAVVMVPDFPVQEGKAACVGFIRELLPSLLQHFERRITYTSTEVTVSGATAIDRGEFAFTVRPKSGGETERVTGKYFWLYERGAGSAWKLSRMIVSRDEAAGAPAGDSHPRPGRVAAAMALPFALVLGIGEVARNWGDWSAWPFWLVDYIAVGLLIAGWHASRKRWSNALAILAGAWGFTCAMFYMSFLLELTSTAGPGGGVFGRSTLLWLKAALLGISAAAFLASLTAGRWRLRRHPAR